MSKSKTLKDFIGQRVRFCYYGDKIVSHISGILKQESKWFIIREDDCYLCFDSKIPTILDECYLKETGVPVFSMDT